MGASSPVCHPGALLKVTCSVILILTSLPRLFSKLFWLLGEGHIKPIFPLRKFAFDEVQDALAILRTGKTHIGKYILSRNAKPNIKVPVRRDI